MTTKQDKPAEPLTILVCDDDPDITAALRIYLTGEGYRVLTAADGTEALSLAGSETVHLVLLDVMMPELDGIQTALRLRETSNVPIIFLSAKGEEADRILGLHAGGDDYIVKPFAPSELFARIRASLRRYRELGGEAATETGAETGTGADSEGCYREGGLLLDDIRKRVEVDGEEATLTALEFKILRLLIMHPDQVFSSRQIYEAVWEEPAFEVSRTVAVHIRHIREKIELDPRTPRSLVLVYGHGYKIAGHPSLNTSTQIAGRP